MLTVWPVPSDGGRPLTNMDDMVEAEDIGRDAGSDAGFEADDSVG